MRRWQRRAGLRARREDGPESEVIRAGGEPGVYLGVGVRGEPDDRVLSDHLSRGPDRQVFLADMHAVGARGASYVRAVVDEEEGVALPAHGDGFLCNGQQVANGQNLQAELDDARAAAEERVDKLQRLTCRGLVDDGVDPAQAREATLLELPDGHQAFTIAHDVLSCRALGLDGFFDLRRAVFQATGRNRSVQVADKKDDLPLKYLDRRVVERYVKKGLIDDKEYARLLKALPDLAEKAAPVDTEFTTADELGPAR